MIKAMLLGILMSVAPLGAYAADNQPATCQSIDQFMQTAKDNGFQPEQFTLLTGTPLETFAANMDRLTGGGHGAMDALVFLTPPDQVGENDVTVLGVFRDHCYIGTAMVSSVLVKKALGQEV